MNVLVLCTGNRYRSPMLAECIRRARPLWTVVSRGTKCSVPDGKVPDKWRACLPDWTEPHAAKKLLHQELAFYQVVIGVQRSHCLEAQQHPCVLLHKLPDPAFHRIAEWPSLAAALIDGVPALLSRIEEAVARPAVRAGATNPAPVGEGEGLPGRTP